MYLDHILYIFKLMHISKLIKNHIKLDVESSHPIQT